MTRSITKAQFMELMRTQLFDNDEYLRLLAELGTGGQMMADYIRREDALHAVQRQRGPNRSFAQNEMLNRVKAEIIRAPAADVAPVVRCKDCMYARDLGFQFGRLVHESWFCICNGPHTTDANDFCSHGQKREEGEVEDDP